MTTYGGHPIDAQKPQDKRLQYDNWQEFVRQHNQLYQTSFDQNWFVTLPPNLITLNIDNIHQWVPWHLVLFGFRIEGQNVRIFPGEIDYKQQIFDVEETVLTIGADLQYIFVQMAWATGKALIDQTNNRLNTVSDATFFRQWLYQFNLIGSGVVSLRRVGHFGKIIIPSVLA